MDELWSNTVRLENGCLQWNGPKTSSGYGSIVVGWESVSTHRLSWELSRGRKVPEGKCILHKCDNKLCIEPTHIYCGTYSDNNADRAYRNPDNQGGTVSRLYSGEIWLIKKLLSSKKISKVGISKMFKISEGVIRSIGRQDRYLSKEGIYI